MVQNNCSVIVVAGSLIERETLITMPLICPHCGAYALNNTERNPSSTTCSQCGKATPANIFPLFVVTGASGAGKTSIIPALRQLLPECIIFDKDLLWGRCDDKQFYNNWLRIAYSIAQGGRHTVICGTIMPWDLDSCEDRGLVGTIHFLNLHCSDEIREQRLRNRPAWRASSSEAFILEHKRFAQWLLDNATTMYDPPMLIVDTSKASVEEVAHAAAQWVLGILGGQTKRTPTTSSSSA
jgi:chloramphenicol 3-O-phosphotransferase